MFLNVKVNERECVNVFLNLKVNEQGCAATYAPLALYIIIIIASSVYI